MNNILPLDGLSIITLPASNDEAARNEVNSLTYPTSNFWKPHYSTVIPSYVRAYGGRLVIRRVNVIQESVVLLVPSQNSSEIFSD
jgi:hypothetical protein